MYSPNAFGHRVLAIQVINFNISNSYIYNYPFQCKTLYRIKSQGDTLHEQVILINDYDNIIWYKYMMIYSTVSQISIITVAVFKQKTVHNSSLIHIHTLAMY